MKIQTFLILMAASLLTSLSYGQDRATIRGTITDPGGALVAGAHVELKSPTTGLRRESFTGSAGLYEFDSLPVGSYQLSIVQNGFREITVNEITLQYSEIRTLDERLELGAISDFVEVAASLEGLNRANAEVGEVVLRKIDVEIFGVELDAHQEQAGFRVSVLVGMQDVSAVAIDEVGDGRDFALRVGARDEQDGGGFHGLPEFPPRLARGFSCNVG